MHTSTNSKNEMIAPVLRIASMLYRFLEISARGAETENMQSIHKILFSVLAFAEVKVEARPEVSTWNLDTVVFRPLSHTALFTWSILKYADLRSPRRWYSPCLLVAEFLGDDFAQVQSQPVRHSLGQVVVRAPAKKHDVGHIRGWADGWFGEEEGEENKKEGMMQRKERGNDEATGLRLRFWRIGRLGGASLAAGKALHWRCGRAERRREIMCTAGREVAFSHWTRRQSTGTRRAAASLQAQHAPAVCLMF